MVTGWKDWLLPDEWQSAFMSFAEMLANAKATSHFWLKQLVGWLVPFLVGAIITWVFTYSSSLSESFASARLGTAVIAFTAIVSGFMITLMLFTGRVDGAQHLSAAQAERFRAKVSYLLLTQGLSVFAHVMTAVSAIVWMMMLVFEADQMWLRTGMVMMNGLAIVSVVRTILVPLQIFELHSFALDALVTSKQDEEVKEIEAETDRARQAIFSSRNA